MEGVASEFYARVKRGNKESLIFGSKEIKSITNEDLG
jgi:hypothetical protein